MPFGDTVPEIADRGVASWQTGKECTFTLKRFARPPAEKVNWSLTSPESPFPASSIGQSQNPALCTEGILSRGGGYTDRLPLEPLLYRASRPITNGPPWFQVSPSAACPRPCSHGPRRRVPRFKETSPYRFPVSAAHIAQGYLVFFVVLETFSPSSLSLLVFPHSFHSSVNTLHDGSCKKRLLYWRRLRRKFILLEYELPRGDLPSMADMLL